MKKIILSLELLTQLYERERKSSLVIAKELGISRQTVVNKLKEFGIPIREFAFKKGEKGKLKIILPYQNKEVFAEVYAVCKSINKVAEYFHIDIATAYAWKKKHSIPTILENSSEGIFKRRSGKPWCNKELLEEEYSKHSLTEIADKWGCSPTTISEWMNHYGIPKRELSEQWTLKSKWGNRIINQGKIDLDAYKKVYDGVEGRLSSKLLTPLRNLVGKCQLCGYSEVLDLHHINHNDRDNRPENHIFLCPNCHAKVHRLGMEIDATNLVSWETLLNTYAEAK